MNRRSHQFLYFPRQLIPNYWEFSRLYEQVERGFPLD